MSKKPTPDKLLVRLLILIAQTKAGNSSNKLKNEIKQILYLLYQHNKIINLPLINYEMELDLRLAIDCVISKISRAFRVVDDPNTDPPAY